MAKQAKLTLLIDLADKLTSKLGAVESRLTKFQSRYVKFYKDRMMIIDCELDKHYGLEVKTWYSNKISEKDLRQGILIKKGKSL